MSSLGGEGDCDEARDRLHLGKKSEPKTVVTEAGDGDGAKGPLASSESTQTLKHVDFASDETQENVQTITCNGFTIEASPSQRRYLGASASAAPGDPEPEINCELYVGRLPKDVLENELIPLFGEFGGIWDLRLLMNASSFKNRGYAFVKFTNPESAKNALAALNNHALRPGTKGMQLEFCKPRVRLFIGNIPKAKSKEELFAEFSRRTRGLKDVIIYKAPEDKKKNRGFCFLEYDNHTNAFSAKKLLGIPFAKVWGCEIIVDWADPIEEPEGEVMEQVKVLYVRNLTSRVHEDTLRDLFATYGTVERVKRIKDFAFVHFDQRENAEKALGELNNKEFHGAKMEVTWAKPPVDNQRKEEVLRARERRMTEMQRMQNSQSLFLCPPIQLRFASAAPVPIYADLPFEYEEVSPYDYDYEYDHSYYPHLPPARYSASEEMAFYGSENLSEYSATHASLIIDDSYGLGHQQFHPQARTVRRSGRGMGRPSVPLGRNTAHNSRHQCRGSFQQGKEFGRSELVDHDDNWRGNAGRGMVEQSSIASTRPPGDGNDRRSRSWRRRN